MKLTDWLALGVMHWMMCAMFTASLAIPTGWETAIIGGPMMYVLLCKAAADIRSIEAVSNGDDDGR